MVWEVSRERAGGSWFVESELSEQPGVTVVDELVRQLAHGPLVVLTGKPGSGRTTTAVRALEQALPKGRRFAIFASAAAPPSCAR